MNTQPIHQKIQEWKTLFFQAYAEESYQKHLIWLGHLFFIAYLVMCAFLWRERMLHFDTANYSYHLLLSHDFYAGMNRWIGYLPQAIPLLLISVKAPLWLVLLSYSVSIGLFYYLAYWVIIYGFKSPRLGLFLCLSLCLCLRYKFYGPVGEIILSIPLIALLLAAVNLPFSAEGRKNYSLRMLWPSLLISFLLVFTAHPFAVLSALVVMGFVMVYKNAWRNIRIWISTAILMLGSAWKYLDLQNRVYETQRLDRVQEWWSHWSNLADFYAFDRFIWYFDTEYHFAFFFFCIVIALLLQQKNWRSAAYFLLSSLLISFLVISLHGYLQGPIYIMLDGYLAHLGLLWSLGIVFVVLRKPRRFKVWLIGALLLFSIHRIWLKRTFFQDRESYFMSIFAQNPNHPKLLSHERDFDWDRYWLHWASGAETLLMTASLCKEKTATLHFLYARDSLNTTESHDSSLLLHHFLDSKRKAAKELPKYYFQLPKVPYHPIDLSE